MSRHFTGSANDSVSFAVGALTALEGGPMSAAVLWRPTTNHIGTLFQASNSGNYETWGFFPVSDGYLWHSIGGSSRATTQWTATDGWRIDGFSKPDGTAQMVRGHAALLGGAWAHADTSTANDTTNGPNDVIRVGSNNIASMSLNGDIAAIVICSAVWDDATFETLSTGLLAWDLAIGSDAAVLWGFNQADIGTAVVDLTGGGADQTAISGTSVGDDPPGWSYALAPPVSISAAGTTPVPTSSGQVDVTPTAVVAAGTTPVPTSSGAVEVANPTTVAATSTAPVPTGAAGITVVQPSLWPDSEVVAVGWLRGVAGLSASMVSTKLPRDGATWSAGGFVTVGNGLSGGGGIVGGRIDPHTELCSPVVSVHGWAVNLNSGKPPLGKASQLLQKVWRACCDESTIRRQVSLPDGYYPVRVNEAYLLGPAKRIPGDEASYAHFQVDLQLHWVVLS